jgi:polysaccharide export outer membrane protein
MRRLALVLFALAGCATTGDYVWVAEVPRPPVETSSYRIRDIDTVSVRVYNQDNLTTRERVRPDGRIAVPFVGDIEARGKTPQQLGKEIEVKLKGVIVAPVVSVSVEQSAQITVSVVGEVRNAGTFAVDSGSTVLHALASAGGLSDYASDDRIFVLRKNLPKRVRFKYSDLRDGDPRTTAFTLEPGDLVVVE